MTKLMETVLNEGVDLKVDRENGVIRGVKILSSVSKNRRRYTDKAIQDAVRLYEGCQVFIDHPKLSESEKERGFADLFGEIQNVRKTSDGVYGDLPYNREHACAGQVCEAAERFPRSFGLSHNANGVTTWDNTERVEIVEGLEEVRSVDLVTRPATVAGLFEGESQGGRIVKLTVKQLIERVDKRSRSAKLLVEQEEAGLIDGDMPVEVESDASSDDQVKAAFREAVLQAFDDDSLDTAATLARIKEILKAQEKLQSGGDAGGAGEGGDSAAGGDAEMAAAGEMTESIKALTGTISRMQAENDARDLLESEGVQRNPKRVKALVGCDSDRKRDELLEDWRQADTDSRRSGDSGGRPMFSPGIMESEGQEKYPEGGLAKSF